MECVSWVLSSNQTALQHFNLIVPVIIDQSSSPWLNDLTGFPLRSRRWLLEGSSSRISHQLWREGSAVNDLTFELQVIDCTPWEVSSRV